MARRLLLCWLSAGLLLVGATPASVATPAAAAAIDGSSAGYVGCLVGKSVYVYVCLVAYRLSDGSVRVIARGSERRAELPEPADLSITYTEEVIAPPDALRADLESGSLPELELTVDLPRTGAVSIQSSISGFFNQVSATSGRCDVVLHYLLRSPEGRGINSDSTDRGTIDGVEVVETPDECNLYFAQEVTGVAVLVSYMDEAVVPD